MHAYETKLLKHIMEHWIDRSHPLQVSQSEYTSQMKETSHLAIVSLLDEITSNQTLSHSKKKQLLKKVSVQKNIQKTDLCNNFLSLPVVPATIPWSVC